MSEFLPHIDEALREGGALTVTMPGTQHYKAFMSLPEGMWIQSGSSVNDALAQLDRMLKDTRVSDRTIKENRS
jgi:hypothetical protein